MLDLDAKTPELPTADLRVVDAPQTPTKAERRRLRRVASRRFARLTARASAKQVLAPLPVSGESLHLVMDGNFSGWSLCEAAIELLGEPVERLVICTLGFNSENAASLCDYLDRGVVKSVLLTVSHYFRHSDRSIFDRVRGELEGRGQTVVIARCHAKLVLAKTSKRNLVIESSANLRSSQNYEQATVADDPALLNFHEEWIRELCLAKSKT